MNIECPHCGGTQFQFVEEGVFMRDVLTTEDGSVYIGKSQDGEVYEAWFMCNQCGRAVPELDDYDQEFTEL